MVSGPAPNPNARRRNKDTLTGERKHRCPECGTPKRETAACAECGTPGVGVVSNPGRSGRELQAPELPNPKRWLKATVDWWEAWARSRQTAVFEPSDWETLKALLPIVDAMNREKDPIRRMKLFEAIHKAEKALGGTHIERLKGRIDVRDEVPGEAVAQAERTGGALDCVAVLDEYRDLAN